MMWFRRRQDATSRALLIHLLRNYISYVLEFPYHVQFKHHWRWDHIWYIDAHAQGRTKPLSAAFKQAISIQNRNSVGLHRIRWLVNQLLVSRLDAGNLPRMNNRVSVPVSAAWEQWLFVLTSGWWYKHFVLHVLTWSESWYYTSVGLSQHAGERPTLVLVVLIDFNRTSSWFISCMMNSTETQLRPADLVESGGGGQVSKHVFIHHVINREGCDLRWN